MNLDSGKTEKHIKNEGYNIEAVIQAHSRKMELLFDEIRKIIVGQENIAKKMIIAMLAGGHVLIEGLPGLAKTTLIKALSEACDLKFKRIQFTPDLLPADLIGTQIYNPQISQFSVKKGPIFSNLVLADEINRAPAKVQSALLESMEELQVTLGEHTFKLTDPFLVMATQNPIEQEGTYPLPEAQIDRFIFKLMITYPSKDEEIEIVKRSLTNAPPSLESIITSDDIVEMRKAVHNIYISDKILKYIVDIVFVTRSPKADLKKLKPLIECGASPRASIRLAQAARASAFLDGRSFVTPDDIKDIAHDVLRHRIKVSFEAEAEQVSSDNIISQILELVDVP